MRVPNSPINGPYKGLVPYSEEDAHLFFGRDSDRKTITANLLGARLTLLYGASGVGKSSVLRAGVAYHLRQLARENRRDVGAPELAVVVFDAWQEYPARKLLDAVRLAVNDALEDQSDKQELAQGTLCEALHKWVGILGGDLLIIFDQFEEYFLNCESGREVFATEFIQSVNSPRLRVNFLISIREDALAWMDLFKGRIPTLFDNYLRLDHLDTTSAREAIVRPVEEWSKSQESGPRSVDPNLREEVLRQILSGNNPAERMSRPLTRRPAEVLQIEAPVLQVVMARLWEEEVGTGSAALHLATLQRLGGAKMIFEEYLDDRLRDLSRRELATAGSLFRQLITTEGNRLALSAHDLEERTDLPLARVEKTLGKLVLRHVMIVRARADTEGEKRYEVAHDILGQAILTWRRDYERRRKTVRRLRRVTLAAAGCLLLLLLISAGFLLHQSNQQKRLASAERLAAKSLDYSERQPDLALLLAVQAARIADSSEVRNTLLTNLQKAPKEQLALGTRLGSAGGTIESISFSPNGRLLASGSRNGRIQIWDLDRGRPINEVATRGAIWSLAFSPDGSTVAAGGQSGKILLWLVRQNRSFLLDFNGRGIEGIAFSPNGGILAWADLDWTIQLWRLNTHSGRPLPPLVGHKAGVWDVAFSPDGKRIASGGEDMTVRLWDVKRGEQIGLPLTGHERGVVSVAYAPDGELLASGGLDGRVLLWDPQQGRLISPMIGSHTGEVSDIAFSPDGALLASCGRDGHVRIWSPLTRQPLGDPLGKHRGEAKSVAFRPDGRVLASSDSDGDLFLWDVDIDSWLSRACAKANRNLSLDEWRQLVDPEAPYEKSCPDLPPGE